MLLSGSPPFYGKTVEDVYKATSTQDPVFPDKKFRYWEFKSFRIKKYENYERTCFPWKLYFDIFIFFLVE